MKPLNLSPEDANKGMTAAQFQSIATAYKLSKSVLNDVEDGPNKHTVFVLSSAVGALESLCLQENRAGFELARGLRLAKGLRSKPKFKRALIKAGVPAEELAGQRRGL